MTVTFTQATRGHAAEGRFSPSPIGRAGATSPSASRPSTRGSCRTCWSRWCCSTWAGFKRRLVDFEEWGEHELKGVSVACS